MSRVVLLVGVDPNCDWDGVTIEDFNVIDMRQYDMTDHEQCAVQFIRELVMQGKTPDPETERLIVIGGEMTVNTLEGTQEPMPVSRVPYTIWAAVPPKMPQWGAKKL